MCDQRLVAWAGPEVFGRARQSKLNTEPRRLIGRCKRRRDGSRAARHARVEQQQRAKLVLMMANAAEDSAVSYRAMCSTWWLPPAVLESVYHQRIIALDNSPVIATPVIRSLN